MTNLFRVLTCLLLAGAAMPAMGAMYADQTALDLFRHYDRATGLQLATVTSPQNTNGAKILIDGGGVNAQVDGSTTRWDMLFTLSDVCYASRLVLDYTGYHPDTFSVYYSTTGADDDWTLLTAETLTHTFKEVENAQGEMVLVVDTHPQNRWELTLPGGADGTAIKYLKIEQDPSSADNHIRMSNIQLFAAANNTFDDEKDGFNYFANVANRPATYVNKSGMSGDEVLFMCEAPNNVFDNNPISGYVRPYGAGTEAVGDQCWYVVPLGELKALWGVNMGYYDNWGSCYIDVSADDDMPIANPLTDGYDALAWTNVYANAGNQTTQFIWFGEDGVEAQWVRVRFAGGNGLTEMELYVAAVPEPATMALLTLGGLALLRRRR